MGNKPRLLITGAGGLLGHALCQAAGTGWQVIGIYRRHRPTKANGQWIQMDLSDDPLVRHRIRALQPDAMIHAAAAAQTSLCQAQPEKTEAINVRVPALLSDLCAEMAIPMAFTSTDLVFDGQNPPYREESLPRPLSVYGDQKARAEKEVLKRWPSALVCRLPLLFGLAPNSGNTFTVQMIEAIAANQPVTLFDDEFRTPVDTAGAARGILDLLGRSSGVLHLGGRERVSRLEIGLMSARAMGVTPGMIKAVHSSDLPGAEMRARDCSLDSRRAFDLGYAPLDLEAAIRHTLDAMTT